jgi:N-acetylneuraminate synthase
LGHLELLNAIAKEGKYTFISTGMSTLEEINNAVRIFRINKCPFTLMHCNSQYPMPDKEANLLCIPQLREMFDCSIGYSAHSPGIIDGIIAVCLGATSVEKHITLNRTMYGTDQASSVEPHGFAKMVEYIRTVEVMLGNGIKTITNGEEIIRKKLWREEDVKGIK